MHENKACSHSADGRVRPVDNSDIPGCGSSLWARLRFVANGAREVGREYRDRRQAHDRRSRRGEQAEDIDE